MSRHSADVDDNIKMLYKNSEVNQLIQLVKSCIEPSEVGEQLESINTAEG